MTTNEILDRLNTLIPNPKCSLNYTKDYELLIAVMLSAQSTDARVNTVTPELFKYGIDGLAKLDVKEIERIIAPVGTQKRKSMYVKEICIRLLNEADGIVPHDRNYLESLPGIGHKTCNVVFSELFGENVIAVDTHVTRISKRLGFADEDDDVIAIENKLSSIFPKSSLGRLHLQLVLFGRHFCTAKKPKCLECPFRYNQCKKPEF